MNIGVTGCNGNVGRELVKRGCVPLECDVTDINSIKSALEQIVGSLDVIIHCAAMTDVLWCEQHPKDAMRVNVWGTSNLVECMNRHQTLVLISTNHVFSGKNYFPYAEIHSPSPTNIYGFTKWTAENAARFSVTNVIVVRSNKLFANYLLSEEIKDMKNRIIRDYPTFIKRNFTYLPDFVDSLLYVANNVDKMPPLLHVSSEDISSYYQFMQLIAMELGIDHKELVLARNHEIDGLIPRPYRGGFNVSLAKKYKVPIPVTFDGIRKMLAE